MRLDLRRIGVVAGAVLVVLGVFWAGRESGHGSLSVFWEHWWCPLPLVIIVLGIASMVAARWHTSAAA